MNMLVNLDSRSSYTRIYWCHLCKRQFNRIFVEGTEVFCRNCEKSFCEELSNNENENDHPSHFVPYAYDENSSQSNSRSNSVSSSNSSESFPQRLLAIYNGDYIRASFPMDFLSYLIGPEENNMDSILNYLMLNDTNKYGNPPASKLFIETLENFEVNEEFLKIKKNENNFEIVCSVCKDEFEVGQILIKLPCNHIFNKDCILPWLNERNSCPTCRFELPTDDTEYEKDKNNSNLNEESEEGELDEDIFNNDV